MLRKFLIVLLMIMVSAMRGYAADVDAPALQSDYAEAIRAWMSGRGGISNDFDDPWIEYLAVENASPAGRERVMRDLLESDPPESLRRVILLDLQSDLDFQSDQAQFIRRYGFYANWFNRAFYVGSRAVQGNITAAGQLVVDAVFDFAGRGQATTAERRLYKLLDDLRVEGRATRQDRERIRELKTKIERAQAEVDLERAEWAMRQGQPELARFYAQGAATGRSLKQSGKIIREAEAEIARRVRGSIASAQAGYPDREPPIDINSPALMRAALNGTIKHHAKNALLIPADALEGEPPKQILITSSTQPYQGSLPDATEVQEIRTENFVLAWMMTTMDPADHDPVASMRRWARVIENMGVDPKRTAWVRAGLDDPAFNPELRLIQAQAARRASVARFVFLGPQTGRERAYVASSRFAQTWNAIASIGVFYVFEVAYRAGIAAVKPPAPADEIFDAQAAFLRAAPGSDDAEQIAEQLADQYLAAGRPDNAEAVLMEHGGVDSGRETKIANARAAERLDRAERMPTGSESRKALISEARELTSNYRLGRRADKMEEVNAPREERIEVRATWASLAEWVKQPQPSGMPGDALWFDGVQSNGEIAHPWFLLESEGAKANEVNIVYYVQMGDRRKIVSESVALEDFGPETRRWVTLALEDRARAIRESQRLGRTQIPYEFTGGAGFSGLDFYPRLLPIESTPGESRLYEDPGQN